PLRAVEEAAERWGAYDGGRGAAGRVAPRGGAPPRRRAPPGPVGAGRDAPGRVAHWLPGGPTAFGPPDRRRRARGPGRGRADARLPPSYTWACPQAVHPPRRPGIRIGPLRLAEVPPG